MTLALSSAAFAAGERLAIRPDHPRIFFNADTWPQVKARAEGPAKACLDQLLAACDKMTDNPVCTGTGPVNRKAGKQADGSYTSLGSTPVSPIHEFGTAAAPFGPSWSVIATGTA
ncbi:MAG: hypothetical protein IJV01_04535 [Bacteroidales bacterium]|nr:hypothetical protein [Bacteroidales bacterium]